MSVIRLVRTDLHLLDAALVSDDALAAVLGHDVVAGWATFTAALQTTRDAVAANTSGAPWGARFFVAGDPPELVGWVGFKGPPADGIVELGYDIAEARRGRGLATAATRAMLAEDAGASETDRQTPAPDDDRAPESTRLRRTPETPLVAQTRGGPSLPPCDLPKKSDVAWTSG